MIPFKLSTIAPVIDAERIGIDVIIESIVIDTRIIKTARRCLFIALKGKKFDSHNFAKQAVDYGAIALLVNHYLSLEVPQLIVADTKRALGQLGSWVRKQIPVRVLALTGSSGKTSVKEMTNSILSQCGQVLATPGNFNNEIGVPLTLLNLTPADDFAVIELGASQAGEIAYTTNLVHPETALVNNISVSHLVGFGSLAGVSQAKGEIFTGLSEKGCGIINADSHDWMHWKHLLINKSVWRFSTDKTDNVDFFASNISRDQWSVYFTIHSPLGNYPVRIMLPGKHNISNALAACALSMSVGAKLSAVVAGLEKFKAIPGRLFPITLSDGHFLLDDSYNANFESMMVAIQVLAGMPGYRIIVVGDMAELGIKTEEYHQQIGEAIALTDIDKVLSIGNFSRIICEYSCRGEHFKDKNVLIARIKYFLYQKSIITILIKGSRIAAMEQIVSALQEK